MKTRLLDYVIRVHEDPSDPALAPWNALLEKQAQATPFMRLEYLRALHESGSAVPGSGWQAQFLSVWLGDTLVAACPAYLKSHSYGEYGLLCRSHHAVRTCHTTAL